VFSMMKIPTVFSNFVMWNIVLLTTRLSGVTKFTTLTPLLLLISCKLSFLIVELKISTLPTFALKISEQNVHAVLVEWIEYVL
jgi:hypothetical protein